MFQLLRGIVLIAAMMVSCGFAFAEGMNSANEVMPGCREQLEGRTVDTNYFYRGLCSGLVVGISYAASGICQPKRATHGQTLRVVMQYIDGHPARLHEDFNNLALEALRAAWPCKK